MFFSICWENIEFTGVWYVGPTFPRPNIYMCVCVSIDYEWSMLLISSVHGNLVITEVGIHKVEKPVSSYCINHLVCPWQWRIVLRTDFVEIDKVYTNSSISMLFFIRMGLASHLGLVTSLINPLLRTSLLLYVGLHIFQCWVISFIIILVEPKDIYWVWDNQSLGQYLPYLYGSRQARQNYC